MSSYLTIYIVPKRKSNKEKKRYIPLAAYSRSTDIYQYFNESVNPVYIGNGEEIPYTTLTKENVASVLSDFAEDIQKAQARLVEYEKYASNNPDYISEIIELKEYIQDLQYWKDKASFIQDILCDMSIYTEIEEVSCNID